MEKPNTIRLDEAHAASLTANEKNRAVVNNAVLQRLGKDTLTIEFVKPCGHRPAGTILEASVGAARQYMAGGFAELWIAPDESDGEDQAAPLYQEALNEADEKKG